MLSFFKSRMALISFAPEKESNRSRTLDVEGVLVLWLEWIAGAEYRLPSEIFWWCLWTLSIVRISRGVRK